MRLTDAAVLCAANLYAGLRNPKNSVRYVLRKRRLPLFATPRGHSALVQWRKLFDHNPQFMLFCDKLKAKQWAIEHDPSVAVAETVWSGGGPEDIPGALLQPRYVIKANHGWGFNYFPHREPLPRREIERRAAGWLARPFRYAGQWGDARVERRLYVERLVGDGEPIWEATFRCHDGVVSAYYVAFEQKTPRERGAFFDADGRRLPAVTGMAESEQFPSDFLPPPFVSEAKVHAARLSRGIDYVRIDFMFDGEKIYFCEFTVYPGSGYSIEQRAHIAPLIERAWLESLPKSWFLSTAQRWPRSIYAAAFLRWLERRRREDIQG